MSTGLFDPPGHYATMSDDGVYRYTLGRCWDWSKGAVVFIMLNPSTADATHDDRTIGRCRSFARDLGYGGIHVVNLFALRSTDPAGLALVDDPVGPDNDTYLKAALATACEESRPVIAGWGTQPGIQNRVAHLLTLHGAERLTALRINADGSPQHPLYISGDARPVSWPRERVT